MKLKYLGTAAAEGFPAVFCACENCRKARTAGGKNIRTRSQAIIDDKLLIDYPCDSYCHFTQHNIDILKANHCLITHIHRDHLYPFDFGYTQKVYAHPPKDWHFTIYGSEDVLSVVGDYIEPSQGVLRFHEVKPFEPFYIDNYTITALKAEHGTEHPYIYMIFDGVKTILYAHDTDFFPEETWEYLSSVKPIFDLVSLDCTEGAFDTLPYKGHMCLGTNIACQDKMLTEGYINQNTIMVLNHFSHNGLNSTYDEFHLIAEKHGFITSYDGMELHTR